MNPCSARFSTPNFFILLIVFFTAAVDLFVLQRQRVLLLVLHHQHLALHAWFLIVYVRLTYVRYVSFIPLLSTGNLPLIG